MIAGAVQKSSTGGARARSSSTGRLCFGTFDHSSKARYLDASRSPINVYQCLEKLQLSPLKQLTVRPRTSSWARQAADWLPPQHLKRALQRDARSGHPLIAQKAESRRNDRGTWSELQRMVSRCCIYTLKRTRLLLLRDIRIVYKLARILAKSRKLDHIPPVLISTRWLPVHTGSDFKIWLPAYKILHGSASVTPGAPARAPEIPVWQLLDHSINKQNIGRW